LRKWAKEKEFDVLYDPYQKRTNQFDAFIRSDSSLRAKLLDEYRFNVYPTSDDDPFFFQFYRWRSILDLTGGKNGISSSKGGYSLTRVPLGLMILGMSLVQMVLLSIVFILAPLWMRQRLRTNQPGRMGMLLYFTALGLGFIFIEITLLQKFSVFVGGPVYSMAITLSSVLVFSGLGSYVAQLFHRHPGRWLWIVIAVLVAMIPVEIWFFNHVIERLMYLSVGMRWLTTSLAIAPMSLLMGMPFPTGLRILQHIDESIRPWAWGINSCATVIGSILCVILSIQAGFSFSMLVAGAIYIVGGFGMAWAVWYNHLHATGK
jgi:hypothetical protein